MFINLTDCQNVSKPIYCYKHGKSHFCSIIQSTEREKLWTTVHFLSQKLTAHFVASENSLCVTPSCKSAVCCFSACCKVRIEWLIRMYLNPDTHKLILINYIFYIIYLNYTFTKKGYNFHLWNIVKRFCASFVYVGNQFKKIYQQCVHIS